MALGDNVVLVRESQPMSAEMDRDVIMFNVRAGAYFSLNGVGSEIWRMLSEPLSVRQIRETLAQRYDVETAALAADVDPFLTTLIERELVRVIKPDHPG